MSNRGIFKRKQGVQIKHENEMLVQPFVLAILELGSFIN